MESASIPLTLSPSFFFLFLCSLSLATSDSITQSQSIKDGETVTSQGNVFELGFFSPKNSQNRYVGIWYHLIPVRTIVWVANRENPLPDSSGILTIASDGNLVILDGRTNRTIWSTNTSIPSNSTAKATILDSGNLILRGENTNSSSFTFWQSFQDPSDTLLPGMKVGYNFATRKNLTLRSWENETDPTPGNFSFGIDLQDANQFFIWKDSSPHWRSAYWNNRTFNLIPGPSQPFMFHFNTVSNENEIYIQYTALYNNTRLVMDVTGEIQCRIWYDSSQTWGLAWVQPKGRCRVYDVCGKNSRCSYNKSPACDCLPGFEPVSSSEWKSGNWRSGCVRRMPLECGDADKFVSLGKLKVPDHEFLVAAAESYDECKAYCIAKCSCNAFVYANGSGSGALQCLVFFGTLTDIADLKETDGEEEIFLRIPASELSSNRKKMVSVIIPVAVVIAILLLGALFYCLRRYLKKEGNEHFASFASDSIMLIENDSPNANKFVNDGKKGVDIPFFTFDSIAAATDYFSDSNMLGKGGFGSVYKGQLPGGQLIAVKRLSRESGQGLEQFKTEAILIAKLQHRNLVRLLGYSIKRDEKMLLYEYMPNKSLDSFLFDQDRCKALDWKKRFKIILGIARGLLYLHQDSRLRIIHRDLKPSNILLDEDLTPKISDFGMARIFGGDQTEGNTRRIVGTYGYMSPEYASHGLFSDKSDVYSFGIILLEIISGVKNGNFIHFESSSIPEYTWHLWREANPIALLDRSLSETCNEVEVLKCIHVALLCVQGNAADRPTMASVLAMLSSQSATLPTPNEPAFIIKRNPSATKYSKNEVTLTVVEGR